MLVLAIDTTSDHGGVAVYQDRGCLASNPNTGSSGYSVTLFHSVERVLADAAAKLSRPSLILRDIELFAVANGPGSFTGIRTGLAATQGWATALGTPVHAVSILEGMAEECSAEAGFLAPIMDARRGEFYTRLFRRGSDGAHSLVEPEGDGVVLKPEELQAMVDERSRMGMRVTCIIREQDEAAQALRLRFADSMVWAKVSAFLVGSIARLALEAHRRGEVKSPAALDACYIRRSDAELNWRS
jgi:tRNA threonylcarbamoyladenosine biosynthesis protein TsaB